MNTLTTKTFTSWIFQLCLGHNYSNLCQNIKERFVSHGSVEHSQLLNCLPVSSGNCYCSFHGLKYSSNLTRTLRGMSGCFWSLQMLNLSIQYVFDHQLGVSSGNCSFSGQIQCPTSQSSMSLTTNWEMHALLWLVSVSLLVACHVLCAWSTV